VGKEAALLLSKGSGRDRVKCWHPRGTGDLSWVTAGRCDVSKVKSHGGAGRAGGEGQVVECGPELKPHSAKKRTMKTCGVQKIKWP
jgi:hypothetical protein